MSAENYNILDGMTVGSSAHSAVDNFAYKWVGAHYMIALAVIVLLVLVILYLLWTKREHFMGPNVRNQLGIERLVSGAPTTYAQAMISQDPINIPTFTPDANAAPGAPGSLPYLVLNNSDLACSTRQVSPTDSFAWMHDNIGKAETATTTEGFKTDNDFTKAMAGY